MPRRITFTLAAAAFGLGTLLVPIGSPTAHAGISVPLPPPSIVDEPSPPPEKPAPKPKTGSGVIKPAFTYIL